MVANTTVEEIKKSFGPALEVYPLTKQLELFDLRLLESTSAIKLDANVQNITNITQSVNVGVNQVSEPARVAFQYSLLISGLSEKQEEIIRISARYGEMFRIISGETFADYQLQKFGQLVGINTIWPYWREFVQTITSRMGLPPLTLPVMRPSDLKFSEENKETTAPRKRAKKTRKKK